MAIVINGSTGITATESSSVLGDNAIETADIAANAVTAAKLASTLDLTGKTVTLPAGVGGKVLQVVNATYSTKVTNTSGVLTDTGLTATITPSSASNKILVLVNQSGVAKQNNTYVAIKLLRNSTSLANDFGGSAGFNAAGGYNYVGSASISYLDSPATTSAVTYKTQFRSGSNISNASVQIDSATSSIILMEIAA